MYTADAADKLNNHLLAGKSLNNIGYIYFEQDIFDGAVVNYKKALQHYDKFENVDKRKLRTLTYIGSAYDALNKVDSSYLYFDKCLSLAKETKNKAYAFYSLKNLGVVCYGIKDYDKAIEYFESALALDIGDQVDRLEIQKTHTALLDIYTKIGDLKSAKEYARLVINDLSDVKYTYTLKVMYASLANYYRQTGDYKIAFYYKDLEVASQEQIGQETDAPALLLADKNFYLDQKDREAQIFRSDVFFIFLIGASAFCILLVFFMFVWRNHKKDQVDIQFYGDKYNELRQVLYDKTDKYPKIEAEIKAMLEDD